MILQALQYLCIHCEKSIPEKYSTNLLAHMKIYHPEITIQEENEEECATTAKKEKSEKLQGSLKNYGYSTDRISIAISKDKFLNSIIDLCTINLCQILTFVQNISIKCKTIWT